MDGLVATGKGSFWANVRSVCWRNTSDIPVSKSPAMVDQSLHWLFKKNPHICPERTCLIWLVGIHSSLCRTCISKDPFWEVHLWTDPVKIRDYEDDKQLLMAKFLRMLAGIVKFQLEGFSNSMITNGGMKRLFIWNKYFSHNGHSDIILWS